MGRIHYEECPVCRKRNINPLLTVTDHSVSKENFVIWQCADCTLRFTQDVPDEESIGVYYKSPDYISHSNTDKGFINKMYQKVKLFTLEQKAKLIRDKTGKHTGSLLDMGCGTGSFLHVMKGKGWRVKGIEPDYDARKMAHDLYGVQVDEPSILPELSAGSFDAITLWHVLEHVHELNGYVAKLKEILKPDGRLFIAVPNYQSLDAAIYRLQWAAYDVPRHLYHFNPKAVEELMNRNGLQIVEKKEMWFDSFYISLLSSKYKNGKPNYVGSVIAGLRSNAAALMNKDRCSSLIYIIKKG
ncbi:MAG TPA: class I SAM-dependent methyltransferase [Chitinophagaceae bacterium]|jgi:2-polyprenyl-3-methyl-5-hydroxy-6-metoxy-1,4-benzoquinol methylase|nr:class I SAM-dependent methyltransferase [Chitinophagaceae bacterium]